MLNNDSDDNFFKGEQSATRLSRKLNHLVSMSPDNARENSSIILDEGDGGSSPAVAALPKDTFEDMVARHRDALGDIFDSYNQFLMKESPSRLSYIPFAHSNTKKGSPRHHASMERLLNNDNTQQSLGTTTQLRLGPSSGMLEEMFEERKHPDFFGAIIAIDPEG